MSPLIRSYSILVLLTVGFASASLADASEAVRKRVFSFENTSITVSVGSSFQMITLTGTLMNRRNLSFVSEATDLLTPGLPILVNLNSGGGSHQVFVEFDNFLKKKAAGSKIITYVGPDAVCGSSCIWLFLSGDIRIAAEEALFQFHAAKLGSGALLSSEEMGDYLSRRGLSDNFINYLQESRAFDSFNEYFDVPAHQASNDRTFVQALTFLSTDSFSTVAHEIHSLLCSKSLDSRN